MTTYERVVDGEVVERVTPIDGSHEDTRIGVLVLEGGTDWRVEVAEPPTPTPALNDETPATPAEVPAEAAPENTPSANSAPNAGDAGTNVSEEPDGAATTDGDGTGPDRDKPRNGRRDR